MTAGKETAEERIRREMEEAEQTATAAWKRQLIRTALLTYGTAVIVFIIITLYRST